MHLKGIEQIKVSFQIPVIQEIEGKLKFDIFRDTLLLFYYKNYNIYFLPYRALSLVGDSVAKETIQFNIYLVKEREKEGFFFHDEHQPQPPLKLKSDSVLDVRNAKYNFKQTGNLSMVGADYFDKNQLLTEKFVITEGRTEEVFDTIYYKYSARLNHVKYSLSSELDSIKKMKLYKLVFLNNEKLSKEFDVMLPRRELVYEFNLYPVNNLWETKKRLDALILKTKNSDIRNQN